MFFELLAMLCAGLFAGAAVYITVVEHPGRLECWPEFAATAFGSSYRRAAVMRASPAAVGLVAAVVAWLPTTRCVLDPGLDSSSVKAIRLLNRWAQLHVVRRGASSLGFGLHLWRVAR